MLKVVFMGTPDFAAVSLAALAAAPGIAVPLVVCQPDRPRGRSAEPQAPPVKEVALGLNLPVHQPRALRKGAAEATIRQARPDTIVVAAYGRILPPAILGIPRLGCLNVHASLLPALRGASPIQSAIVQGLPETGVSIMLMDEGLDTGAVLARSALAIGPDEDAGSLHDRLMALGAELLVPTLRAWARGEIAAEPQDEAGATYAPLLTREDGRLDWSLPADHLKDRVRGLHPWPGSFTAWKGRLLKVFPPAEVLLASGGEPGQVMAVGPEGIDVACGRGRLRLHALQVEGKRRMRVADLLHGHALIPGARLGGAS